MALKAWYQYTDWNNFAQPWGGNPINGDDIAMPQGTPITAPFSGTVTNQYQDDSGGTTIVRADNSSQLGGIAYYYFCHFDTFNQSLHPGSHVNIGDMLGTSGGQNSGGTMNASPKWSTGPHIMFGLSTQNAIPVGWNAVTPNLNPHNLYMQIMQTGIMGGSNTFGSSDTCTCSTGYHIIVNGVGKKVCRNDNFPYDTEPCAEMGKTPIQQITDATSVIQNLANALTNLPQNAPRWGEEVGIFVLAVLFIALGIILLAGPDVAGAVKKGVSL